MPHKFERDKTPMPRDKDRRIKLTDEQRDEIRELYGTVSQRKLAAMYGVSRRLIQFIGDPSAQERDLLRRQERGGSSIYYDKAKQRGYMKKHRRYKQEVLKDERADDKG